MMDGRPALIVTTMKDEAPYVLEWVSHHMSLGFDRFFVCTNDCSDGTDRMLDRLSRLIDVTHVPNPKTLMGAKGNWHIVAHRYAALFNCYKDAGHIYFTDVDEFLQIRPGAGTLDDLFEASGGFHVVSFTSMPFGSNGVVEIEDRPVMEQFTMQSKNYDAIYAAGRRAWNSIKTMFDNDVQFTVRRNHRPRRADFSTTGHRWIDGSGRTLPAEWTDGKAKAAEPVDTVALAQFNHYAIRSAEAFLVKVARGDAVGVPRLDDDRALQYWKDYDGKGGRDDRAATPRPEARRIRAGLMADPEVARLHAAAVDWHKARAKALRQHASFAELWDRMDVGTGAPATGAGHQASPA